jgi:ABC-type transport system substrate-binding protein
LAAFYREISHSPKGMIYVVDLSPLNWLYILFNTMEEAVRADPTGAIIPSLSEYEWVKDNVLELKLDQRARFHDGEQFTASVATKNVVELMRWVIPHPPGSFLNFLEGTVFKVLDSFRVQFHFPKRDGLAVGKLRAVHFANNRFWNQLGFGYRKIGTGEGHW